MHVSSGGGCGGPRNEQSGAAALGTPPGVMSSSLWGAGCGCCRVDVGPRDRRACGREQLRPVARPESRFRAGVSCGKSVLVGFCLDEAGPPARAVGARPLRGLLSGAAHVADA